MSKYDVNYNKLVQLLLPMCLRGKRITGLLRAMVAPIGVLYGSFMSFKTEKSYQMRHNGQVCYLRALLNDRFDPVNRAITITEEENAETGVMLYSRELERSVRVPVRKDNIRLPIFRRGFGGSTGCGFWVNVPARLINVSEDEVLAVVNDFKLASIRYGINRY